MAHARARHPTLLTLSLLWVTAAHAARVDVQIEGLSDEMAVISWRASTP